MIILMWITYVGNIVYICGWLLDLLSILFLSISRLNLVPSSLSLGCDPLGLQPVRMAAAVPTLSSMASLPSPLRPL